LLLFQTLFEVVALAAFAYPLLNSKRLAGQMRLSLKMIGVIERLTVQSLLFIMFYFVHIITASSFLKTTAAKLPVMLKPDFSNVAYVAAAVKYKIVNSTRWF
jgi:hypothetical protein